MGGDSRESSPDWLRTFQAPTQAVTTLSSDSELSGDKSPLRDGKASSLLEGDREEEDDDEKFRGIATKSHSKKSPNKKTTKKLANAGDGTPSKRGKTEHQKDDAKVKRQEAVDKSTETPASAPNHTVCELSSDSELNSVESREKKEENDDENESKPKNKIKGKSPKIKKDVESIDNKRSNKPLKIEGEVGDVDAEDDKPVKVSSSTLPLVLPDKVNRSKALVECGGESIDLDGDMGAVGRVIISETPSKESEMLLDLKGTIYKTVIVPSRTFCVVSIGQSEAKIEAIMNDYVQLKPQSNVYDAETMVEGTLEGFDFGSDDEADKMTKEVKSNPSEGAVEQCNKKVKGKAEKKSVKVVATNKRSKDGGKQPKKPKSQATKKGKGKN